MSELEDDGLTRCDWANGSQMMRTYHDEEWGVRLEGERATFERLSLEAFQAGLSWATILRKRPAFREAFRDFDLEHCAALTGREVDQLMGNAEIIRARAKIEATRTNAAAAIELRSDGGLESLVASYAPDTSPAPAGTSDLRASSEESAALAKELRRRGFKFVGPTNMFALMQATGLVNDHLTTCFRRDQV